MSQLLMFDDRTPSHETPLSYFGAKPKDFLGVLSQYLPHNLKEMASPFVGGGRIELQLAAQGIDVYASDTLEPLIQFFSSFLDDASAVCHRTAELCPLSKEEIIHYRCTHFEELSELDTAAIFWLMSKQTFLAMICSQKTNYSQRYSDKLKPGRFLKDKWVNWQNKYFHIEYSDCFDAIEKHKTKFLYCDPPYVGKEQCYGWFDGDQTFDHEKLSLMLKEHEAPWILSYGDHEIIRELYKDYKIIEPTWHYYTSNKKSSELMIVNV